jgi:translocator protein
MTRMPGAHYQATPTALKVASELSVVRNRLAKRLRTTAVASSSTADGSESLEGGTPVATTAAKTTTALDTGAILRYVAALILQMGLLTGLLKGMDVISGALNLTGRIPIAVNFAIFYFLALKSRIFNPLCNARPRPQTKEVGSSEVGSTSGIGEVGSSSPRKMPTWTPPGFVFPIVWILIIGPLRAVSSSLVYMSNGGVYADGSTILWLMLHLSIGDVWNTINNVERRYGTSVVGVTFVWLSAFCAARQYYQASPPAGRLLSVPLLWLTVASTLIFRTWQLNPSPKTGRPESLLPKKKTTVAEEDGTNAKTITRLIWFERNGKTTT